MNILKISTLSKIKCHTDLEKPDDDDESYFITIISLLADYSYNVIFQRAKVMLKTWKLRKKKKSLPQW